MDTTSESGQDYRAFWTTDEARGWTQTVVAQANEWLKPRFGRDIDLSHNGIVRGENKRLQIQRHDHGGQRGLRFDLEEDNQGGRFTSTLTVVENAQRGGWLSLDVRSASGSFVNRPRLAGYLLEVLSLRDGTPITATPSRVNAGSVSDVVEALESPERRGPVFVAATNEAMSFDGFAWLVDEWAKETVGLAQVFVLDPLATRSLNARLGKVWAVPQWTIRTYLPGVDLTSPAEARANRILGTTRLATDREQHLARLLGGVARSVITDRPAPPAWREWQRTFDRVSAEAIKSSASLRPGRPRQTVATKSQARDLAPDVARLEAELDRVRVTLELPDLTEGALLELLDAATSERIEPGSLEELREELDRQQGRAERAEERLDSAQLRLLIADDDARRAEAEAERQSRRARYLAKALVDHDLAGIAYGDVPEDAEPTDGYGPDPVTYVELLDRLEGLADKGVVFTGDRKDAEALELIDLEGKALHLAWRAAVALCEYARAKTTDNYTGSVHKFLEDQPPGYRTFPLNQHAATETGYTKAQYKGTRRFPVPTDVATSGQVDMFEHFKLARINHQDPRLHYFDDTTASGKVYVGYLGVHLVNSMTKT